MSLNLVEKIGKKIMRSQTVSSKLHLAVYLNG